MRLKIVCFEYVVKSLRRVRCHRDCVVVNGTSVVNQSNWHTGMGSRNRLRRLLCAHARECNVYHLLELRPKFPRTSKRLTQITKIMAFIFWWNLLTRRMNYVTYRIGQSFVFVTLLWSNVEVSRWKVANDFLLNSNRNGFRHVMTAVVLQIIW